jgi:hypothetical protein
MSQLGFDCDVHLTTSVLSAAKAAGYVAAGRYLKNLSMPEVSACAASGFGLWLIYETTGSSQFFQQGEEGGAYSGGVAMAQAKALGAPASSVIYVAVDYDAAAGDISFIQPWMTAFQAACLPYALGTYADGAIASQLHTAPGDYVPGASGWEGTQQYLLSGRVALIQHPSANLFGIDTDPVDIVDPSVIWYPALAGRGAPAPPEPAPAAPTFVMPKLTDLQGFLGVVVDGIYGDQTAAAIQAYYEGQQ